VVYGNWVANALDHGIVDGLFPTTYRIRIITIMGESRRYAAAIAVVVIGLATPFLVAAQTPQKSSPKYEPRLGDIMSAVQFRHLKLWAAGRKQNWELAAYELDQVKAGLARR
jgi:hypothetical protein